MKGRGIVLVAAALCGCLTGCYRGDPERVAVAGMVEVEGAPLGKGTVRFIPTSGSTGPAVVAGVEAGKFSVPRDKGPLTGDYRLEVQADPDVGFDVTDDLAYAAAQEKSKKPISMIAKKLRFRNEPEAEVALFKDETELHLDVVEVKPTKK